LLQSLRAVEPCTVSELKSRSHLAEDAFAQALAEGLHQGDVVLLAAGEGNASAPLPEPSAVVMSLAGWQNLRDQIAQLLSDYHRSFPLRRGIPKEELKSRLRLNNRAFHAVMLYAGAQGVIAEADGLVSLPAHRVQFSPEQKARLDEMLAAFHAQPFTPPAIPELERQLGAELLNACFEQNILVKLNEEVAFLPETFEHMRQAVIEFIRQNGSITVAQARDLFGTSRRYALALMGYLDTIGLTRRVGDERVLR
ncbi:MAG: SelB domain-containing protein, partial [Anaerolineae bacterium]